MRRIVLAALAVTLVMAATARADTVGFTDRYMRMEPWWGFECVTSARIAGREPAAKGRYPVFVYLVGLGGVFNGIEAQKFTEEAARRGFVAASLEYDSLGAQHAEGIDKNSRCMFNGSRSSALSKLCSRRKADCAKGVAVAGLSSGAAVAGRAANHSPLVRGAYLLGINGPAAGPYSGYVKDANGETVPMSVPPPAGDRALPNNRLRITIGQADAVAEWPNGQQALDAMTGRSCTGVSSDCLAADGSGYYVVQDHEVDDGPTDTDRHADHCFFHGGGGCSNTPPFEPRWLPPSPLPWALGPNLAWLARQMDGASS